MKCFFACFFLLFQALFATSIESNLTNEALYALQQLRTEIPERLWMQEFSILFDQEAFQDHLEQMMNHSRREKSIESSFALAYPKAYLIRSTLSGEPIRMLDLYSEFIDSPYWKVPEMMERLEQLEAKK